MGKQRTAGSRELRKDGFRSIYEVNLKSRGRGRWFEAQEPAFRRPGTKEWSPRAGGDVLMLRQAKGIWHAFYRAEATGSGSTPAQALQGGLGDAIDTDEAMERYCDLVLSAPERLSKEYDGLYAAQGQCWHERQNA